MWIRIQDQRLKDSQIVEYKGRSKGMASGLENWVHGGDADCIIAEFEEKLNNK